MTSAARLANLAALSARSVPTDPAAELSYLIIGSICLCKTPFDVDPNCPCLRPRCRDRSRPAALAQSGSAGGSIGNDEKSLSGSRQRRGRSRPKSRRDAASPKPTNRAAPREKVAVVAAVAVAISTARGLPIPGTPCGAATERFVDQRRQDLGRTQFRSSQSKRLDDVRRIRLRFELEQFRPFLGPQRLRNVQAIGRL